MKDSHSLVFPAVTVIREEYRKGRNGSAKDAMHFANSATSQRSLTAGRLRQSFSAGAQAGLRYFLYK
jgi:hypothetical protein